MKATQTKNITATYADDREAAGAVRALAQEGFGARRVSAFHPKATRVEMAGSPPFQGTLRGRDVGYAWLIGGVVGAAIGALAIFSVGGATLGSVAFAVGVGAALGAMIGVVAAPWAPSGQSTKVVAAVPTGECAVSVEARGDAEIRAARRALTTARTTNVVSHPGVITHRDGLATSS